MSHVVRLTPEMIDGAVLQEVYDERRRQDKKWGEQNHVDGTGAEYFKHQAARAKARCQASGTTSNPDTWEKILSEEIYEAYAESDERRLREELVQSAAVIVAWIGAIDRRRL